MDRTLTIVPGSTFSDILNVDGLFPFYGIAYSSNEEKKSRNGPRRLVMIEQNKCMLCFEKTECETIVIGDRYGWICCSTCQKDGNLKGEMLIFMEEEKKLPLRWLFKTTMFKTKSNYLTMAEYNYEKKETEKVKTTECKGDAIYLHFFRKSKADSCRPIHTGNIKEDFFWN